MYSSDDDESTPLISHPVRKWPIVTVEPIVLLFMFGKGVYITSFPQYIRSRIAEDYEVSGLDTTNGTCYANISSSEYIMQEQIQKQATMWTLYFTATSQFIAMFVATILGAYSDKAGRKIPLMLPPVGAALNGLNYLIVIYLHLPLWTLFFGAVLQGLGGEHTTEMATCCSYISDITTKQQRTFRMIVLEIVYSFAFGGAQLCAGYAIHIYGYQAAFWLHISVSSAAFFYAVFFVRESLKVEDTSNTSILTFDHFKQIALLFKNKRSGLRLQLVILIVVLFFQILSQTGCNGLYVLYCMDYPFCWSSVMIGYFSAARVALRGPGVLLGGKLLPRCLSDFGMIYVSSISYTSSLLLSAFAFNDIMMFMVPVVAALSSLTIPVIRSRLSRIVDSTEQGILFACLGCTGSIANFVAPVTFNAIYAVTLGFFSGFIFIVLAAIDVINMMLTGFTHRQDVLRSNSEKPIIP
ncbi:lysosomal proton-coupled steroid conjugate and bile acid symporter SLC46A3-like [Saccoglossus kowalevskii]